MLKNKRNTTRQFTSKHQRTRRNTTRQLTSKTLKNKRNTTRQITKNTEGPEEVPKTIHQKPQRTRSTKDNLSAKYRRTKEIPRQFTGNPPKD
ncbi:hypothetical protein F8M41_025359 [Gigaspora margarita]|uniref:Uncharacterized protein n=1 Tax=Gigaspora margarita TaxID=4874 RepID=A0A8H3XMI0_GIGMA|nr:hypothetical protein F8M41_025359 [Gigaspora margarita]